MLRHLDRAAGLASIDLNEEHSRDRLHPALLGSGNGRPRMVRPRNQRLLPPNAIAQTGRGHERVKILCRSSQTDDNW